MKLIREDGRVAGLSAYFEKEDKRDLRLNTEEENEEAESIVEETVYLTINALRHLNKGECVYSETIKLIPSEENTPFNSTQFKKKCGG